MVTTLSSGDPLSKTKQHTMNRPTATKNFCCIAVAGVVVVAAVFVLAMIDEAIRQNPQLFVILQRNNETSASSTAVSFLLLEQESTDVARTIRRFPLRRRQLQEATAAPSSLLVLSQPPEPPPPTTMVFVVVASPPTTGATPTTFPTIPLALITTTTTTTTAAPILATPIPQATSSAAPITPIPAAIPTAIPTNTPTTALPTLPPISQFTVNPSLAPIAAAAAATALPTSVRTLTAMPTSASSASSSVTPQPTTKMTTATTPPQPSINSNETSSTLQQQPQPGCPVLFPPAPPLPGKKGVAFTLSNEGLLNLPNILALNAYWNYGWGPRQVIHHPTELEFVPMIWGAYTVQKTLNETILPQIASGKSRRILGFNEPDNRQQSNIPVERALEHWAQLEAANVPLISPSCVHANGAWMQAFMKNATETCKRVDWIGVHWYGGPNFETFQRYLLETFALYNNRPLLITEFACADFGAETLEDHSHTQSSVLSFMKQALPWLEAQEWIAGYVWFSFNISQPFGTASALFNEGGELTALGRYYSSVRTDTPMGNQSIQAGPWQ